MKGNIFCYWLLVILITACAHQDTIILVPDNDSPPDLTVPDLVKENFVNRAYITLMGRKPEATELSSALLTLDQHNASKADRSSVIQRILSDPTYRERQYNIARIDLLSNLDTAEIAILQQVFNQYLQDPQYDPFQELIYYELDRLEKLSKAAPRYFEGNIGRADMHLRLVNNLFYDDINMGTQNFVLSVFEHFLNRYPTEAEEQNAILMCDGFYTVVFGMEGNSKEDFLGILIDSDAYYEGQVMDIYQRFLFRTPTSVEMGEGTGRYRETNSYDSVLTDVMITDEFLGI